MYLDHEPITRRRLLQLIGMSFATAITACSSTTPKQPPQPDFLPMPDKPPGVDFSEWGGDHLITRILLPKGRLEPGTGVLTALIARNALGGGVGEASSRFRTMGVPLADLLCIMDFRAVPPSALLISVLLERESSAGNPLTSAVYSVGQTTLRNPHIFILGWDDWRIRQATWDGANLISLGPAKPNL